MAGFIDDEDARRPDEFPRLSERYRANVDAAWSPPSRRKLFKGRPAEVEVQVLDLSIAGALFRSQANKGIEIGQKIKFKMNGHEGIVEVRNVRPSSSEAHFYYGVSFFRISDEMKAELFSIVGDIRTNKFEGQWDRAR